MKPPGSGSRKRTHGSSRHLASGEQLDLFDAAESLHKPDGGSSETVVREGHRDLVSGAASPLSEPQFEILPWENTEAILSWLAVLVEQGWLRRIDLEFARFLVAQIRPSESGHHHGVLAARDVSAAAPGSLGLVLLGAALCSWQLGRGHVCLDMASVVATPSLALSWPSDVCHPLRGMTLPKWIAAGAAWPVLVGCAQDTVTVANDGSVVTPLVQAGSRLYMRRYWAYEQQLQAAILERLHPDERLDDAEVQHVMAAALDALFSHAQDQEAARGGTVDWQQIACALVARRRFGLITGGPGTGKTTTVVKLLALLQVLSHQLQGRFLQIGLAAPTGKAAARLGSSINGAINQLPFSALPQGEALRLAIPSTVQTLHRLLGARQGGRHFRYGPRLTLPLDVLVIDEASMVDLEMMAMVVQALSHETRLILLGDKDQLASVEAGAILGELCLRAQAGHYWPETASWIEGVTKQRIEPELLDAEGGRLLDQGIAMLRYSYRFGQDSGIAKLAAYVNQGDGASVTQLWQQTADGANVDIHRVIASDSQRSALEQLVVDGWGESVLSGRGAVHDSIAAGLPARCSALGYAHYLSLMHKTDPGTDATPGDLDAWAAHVLAAHSSFQLLAALRQGFWGVDQLNRQIAQWLQRRGLVNASDGWYAGRPVMVTRNDYELGLMNGDVGMTLLLPGGRLKVAFAGESGERAIRWVLPSRLQAVETVFAMTVHKAQGSEFEHAALVLPADSSPVLTRELIYTAITRARRFFSLCGPAQVDRLFEESVRRRVLRASGLMQGCLAAELESEH